MFRTGMNCNSSSWSTFDKDASAADILSRMFVHCAMFCTKTRRMPRWRHQTISACSPVKHPSSWLVSSMTSVTQPIECCLKRGSGSFEKSGDIVVMCVYSSFRLSVRPGHLLLLHY
ncbi:hypothetical protein DPMN_151041 [Dreissena polymorpha]|uniref:Uncharacterized protein n=1 Tax=Dreissena polymorpha TaxID=45954 RepID=A0A9D4FJ48_DREPO|nr:hypothetical protein DPMN_151041 [Dreissena polymorpha]